MKKINLSLIPATLLLLSYSGYAQFGNLRNKVENTVNKVKSKPDKTGTSEIKTSEVNKTENETGATIKTVPNESTNTGKTYFLYNDIKTIPGATFYFSDKPFGNSHEGAKTNFKSSDFIYGRLELNNQTIQDAFKLTPLDKTYYVICNFGVVNGDNGKYAQIRYDCLKLQPEDINKTAFNFDILPDPAKASTGVGMNYEHGFDATHISGGVMYPIIDESNFPNDGNYTIQLQFYFQPVDGWGKGLPKSSDWPGVNGAFKFSFHSCDVTAIKNNATLVYQNVRTAISTLHAMPDWWPKTSRTLPDASLSNAALEAMIKAALSSEGSVLVRFAVANDSPGGLWIIQKNDLDIPTYQSLAENIYTIYKQDGKCFLGDVSIAKNYLGGGKYGKPYVRNINFKTSGYGTMIDCSAIK